MVEGGGGLRVWCLPSDSSPMGLEEGVGEEKVEEVEAASGG